MKRFLLILKKTLLASFLLIAYSLVIILLYESFIRPFYFLPADYAEKVADPTEKTEMPKAVEIPAQEDLYVPVEQGNINLNDASASPNDLMIPVVGIKRDQIRDTFTDSRSNGRVHNAIDIMAPLGTPVVAVADGEIAKFFDSELGGITIYQYSADRRFVYYYAHLQKRAANLKEKDFVKRGTIIGYVGDSGNAGAGNAHLHFTITTISEGQSFSEGTDINPYPFLKNAIESR
jgi:murein DD-endopeptidase MepM/ murein hydrolase activator NlpD